MVTNSNYTLFLCVSGFDGHDDASVYTINSLMLWHMNLNMVELTFKSISMMECIQKIHGLVICLLPMRWRATLNPLILITDNDFVGGIEFLIKNGIITL